MGRCQVSNATSYSFSTLELRDIPSCPDTTRCPAKRTTVFGIQGGVGGFASTVYLYVGNAILWAWRQGYVPWVALSQSHVPQTRRGMALSAASYEAVFTQPCAGVSRAWAAACPETVVVVSHEPGWYYPCMHEREAWPFRAWYYSRSWASRCCHAGRWCGARNERLYRGWRALGATVVAHAMRLQPSVADAVESAWRRLNPDGATTLGVHMRGTDKAAGRKWLPPTRFLPWVASFLRAVPTGRVVVATDSEPFAAEVRRVWAPLWEAGRVVLTAANTRSNLTASDGGGQQRPLQAAANFATVSNTTAVALDVLLDIQLLARCSYLLHGSSAVAEAAHYTNPLLHARSIDIEWQPQHTREAAPTLAPWRSEPAAGRPASAIELVSADGPSFSVRCRDAVAPVAG